MILKNVEISETAKKFANCPTSLYAINQSLVNAMYDELKSGKLGDYGKNENAPISIIYDPLIVELYNQIKKYCK